MFRRLLVLASLLAATLGISLATATPAAAAPGDVAITAPGPDGDDTTPVITGTADPSLPVHLLINGVEVAELTVGADGTWEYQVTEPLTRGDMVGFTAEVVDDANQIWNQVHSTYYVWPDPVTVSITTPADGSQVGSSIDLAGEWSAVMNGLVVTVDGEPTGDQVSWAPDNHAVWIADLTNHGLPDGPHTFQITGEDLVGRPIASNVVTLVVDTTGPEAPVVTSPAPGSTVRTVDFVFEGTGTAGNQIEVIFANSGFAAGERVTVREDGTWAAPVNDDPSQPGNSSLWVNLSSRTLELLVVETDADGNSSYTEYSLFLDLGEPTTPPAEADPTDDATDDESVAPVAEVTAPRPPAAAAELPATGPIDLRLCLLSLGLVLAGLALRRRAVAVG